MYVDLKVYSESFYSINESIHPPATTDVGRGPIRTSVELSTTGFFVVEPRGLSRRFSMCGTRKGQRSWTVRGEKM